MDALMGLCLAPIQFLFGVVFFSFVNVLAYRIPQGISVVKGRSFCPLCKKELKAGELIPLVSWLVCKGKCRGCGGKISLRYPLVELLGGVLALLTASRFGFGMWFGFSPGGLLVVVFLGLLTAVALIDGDTQEIPDRLVVALLVLALLSFVLLPGLASPLWRGIGLFSVSLPMFLIALFIPGGFGGGDVKLMAVAGLFLGLQNTVMAAVFAVFSGGIYGAVLLLTKRKGRKDHFAFGPFLCAGIAASLFVGEAVSSWYLGLLF